MNLILFVLVFCFFIFMYFLYFLAHDDFLIVRKNISLEKIFSMAILTSLVSFFFARFFFTVFNPKPEYFNPLIFLAIIYSPGLSLVGGIVGGTVFIYLYAKINKIPFGRIFDLFIMSFIGVLPIGFLITYIILLGKTTILFNIVFIFSVFIFFLFTKLIFPFSSKGEIKDGTLGLIFIALLSFIYFTVKLFLNVKTFSFLSFENIFLLITLFSSLVLILNQEIIDKYISKK
jgi:hypothetical protein